MKRSKKQKIEIVDDKKANPYMMPYGQRLTSTLSAAGRGGGGGYGTIKNMLSFMATSKKSEARATDLTFSYPY